MPVKSKYLDRMKLVGGAIAVATTPQAVAKQEKKAEMATADEKREAQRKLFASWAKL